MNAAGVALACVATLLATAVLVVGSARRPMATPLVYGACLAVSLALLATALLRLTGGQGERDALTLPSNASPLLEVADVAAGDKLKRANFTVARGEIFGIAGVSGNGQSELADALCGLLVPTRGEIRVGGAALPAAQGGRLAAYRADEAEAAANTEAYDRIVDNDFLRADKEPHEGDRDPRRPAGGDPALSVVVGGVAADARLGSPVRSLA